MLFGLGTAGETVKVLGQEQRSEYGKLLGYEVVDELEGCTVSPAGDSIVNGDGFIHGDISKLQVLAPAGSVVWEGQKVEIRGQIYSVDFTPFDYSHGRRPVLAAHQPRVIFTVSRGDAHDHL